MDSADRVSRRRKCAQERRAQRERVHFRALQLVLKGAINVGSHRGSSLTPVGVLLRDALLISRQAPEACTVPYPTWRRCGEAAKAGPHVSGGSDEPRPEASGVTLDYGVQPASVVSIAAGSRASRWRRGSAISQGVRKRKRSDSDGVHPGAPAADSGAGVIGQGQATLCETGDAQQSGVRDHLSEDQLPGVVHTAGGPGRGPRRIDELLLPTASDSDSSGYSLDSEDVRSMQTVARVRHLLARQSSSSEEESQ